MQALADEIIRQETGLADGSLVLIGGEVYPNPFHRGVPAVWFEDEATGERSPVPPGAAVRINGYHLDGDRDTFTVFYGRVAG
jgi:hypothetical protein